MSLTMLNGLVYFIGEIIGILADVEQIGALGLMPFTYSISVGIGAGFVSHVLIRLIQGRRKELHPLLLVVSALFVVYFLTSPINTWFG